MNRLIVWLLLCLTIFSSSTLASILAIDYGAEWIKAVLLAPGQQFDILLDKSSKRKVQSSVGWKRDDRLFGSDALAIAGRFPTDSFSYLKYLQGVPFDSQTATFFNSISTAEIVPTSRNTVAVKRSDGTEWAVEELIGMQLAYIRELAETALGDRVTDAVVTVPPYYTQHERMALIAAIEIAGMRAESLVNDGTAVAINYAMTRTFPATNEAPEYHVVYDAGASAVRATVVGFNALPTSGKSSGKGKKEPEGTAITVKGVGFDRSVGGVELDRRLRDILADDFVKKHKKDVRADKRGMAKLWKEAGRVKTILSANAEAMSSVESLAFDVDYRSKVTRSQFEAACKDLQLKFAKPIFDALSNAGLTLDDVTSVIMTGGASRTPMIQSAVKAAVGESKIATNVNADEAAALGAGLYAAGLSRAFRAKEYRIVDISAYDIQTAYGSEAKSEDGTKPQRTIHAMLFPAGSQTLTKKTISIKRKEDVTLRLEYKTSPLAGHPTDIFEADITGVPEAFQNLTEAGAQNPIVKVGVQISESGLAAVYDAVMYGEIKDESLTGKLKSLLGAGSTSSTEAAEGAGETVASDNNTENAKDETTPEIDAPKKKAPVKDTIPLQIIVKPEISLAMSKAEKRNSRDRLLAIDRAEAEKRLAEEARNGLEGYLYRIRDLLEEDGDTPFVKCSKEHERAEMKRKLDETFTWLHEHGDDAKTQDYVKRRSALEKLEYPIMHRYTEIQDFPRALNQSQMWNWSTRMFITEAKKALEKEKESGEPAVHTAEDIAELEKTLIEHEIWLNEAVEKQKAVTIYDDPAVESSELRTRAKVLENHLQRIAKKKVPKRKTAKSSSKSATTAPTTSTTGSALPKESPAAGQHDEL